MLYYEQNRKTAKEIIDASDSGVFLEVQEYQLKAEFLILEVNPEFFKSLEKYGDTPERLVSHSYYLEHTDKFF